MTSQTKSVAQVKSEASNQQQTLVDLVLREQCGDDLPFVQHFRQQHAKITSEKESLLTRKQEITKAAEEVAKQESRVSQATTSVATQKAALDKLLRPLGEAAFAAFQAGHVNHHDAFADRQQLQDRLDELRNEYQALAPKSGAGVVDKTKAGAQQLVVAGKIKLEEAKIGGLHKEIGKNLIAADAEEDVRCESTAQIVEQVRQARSSVEQGQAEVRRTEDDLNATKQQFGQTFGIPVEGKRSLDNEVARCKTAVTGLDHQLQSIVSTLCQEALASQQPVKDDRLRQVLQSMQQTQADLSVAQRQQSETNAKRIRIGLIAAGVAGSGFMLMIVMCCGITAVIGNRLSAAAAKDAAAANELWESGKQADAVTKYRSLIDSSWGFLNDADKVTALQRTVDFDAQHGDESSANVLIEKALDNGITLSLVSQEARTLVAQVKQERREAEERRRREEEERLLAEQKRKEEDERLASGATGRARWVIGR